MVRPRVFMDISIGPTPAGRIVIELFDDKTPKTCENFRLLCTGILSPITVTGIPDPVPLHYKGSAFHRIVPEFMIQGGDITRGDGTGGACALGVKTFADENLGWREIDASGLVCMANSGKGTNASQFFITLDSADYLTSKHTLFGHVVQGMEVVNEIAELDTDKNDKPKKYVVITNCGQLEFKKKDPPPKRTRDERDKDRERTGRSRSRSPKRKERDTDRDRDHHRRGRGRDPSPAPLSKPHTPADANTDADAPTDEPPSDTKAPSRAPSYRGRSRSPSRTSHHHHRRHRRDRSRSPRRRHSRSRSSRFRERSSRSPRRHQHRRRYARSRSPGEDYIRDDPDAEERIRREEVEREAIRGEMRADDIEVRDGWRGGREGSGVEGVKFKGRGSMKYRERKNWGAGGGYGRLD